MKIKNFSVLLILALSLVVQPIGSNGSAVAAGNPVDCHSSSSPHL
jgi:hypothetical protein